MLLLVHSNSSKLQHFTFPIFIDFLLFIDLSDEYQQFDVLSVPLLGEKKRQSLVGKFIKAIREIFVSNEDRDVIRESLSIFLGSCLQRIVLFGERLEKLLSGDESVPVRDFTIDSPQIRKIFPRVWKLRRDFERFCDKIQLYPRDQVVLE